MKDGTEMKRCDEGHFGHCGVNLEMAILNFIDICVRTVR